MEILKFLLKSLLVCVIIAAIVIAGVALYIKFFGRLNIEQMLSRAIGAPVKFQGVSLELDKGRIYFSDITIMNKIDFEDNLFKAEKFVVSINTEKFDKNRTIAIEEVTVEKGILNIERNRKGLFNIITASQPDHNEQSGLAYAAELPAMNGLYALASNFKSIVIKDSIINFKDNYISQPPFACYFNNVDFQFKTTPSPNGNIGANCSANFRIPMKSGQNGSLALKADMTIYSDKTNLEATLQTRYINLMLFLPYFEKNTPFSFQSGSFSSDTTFRMHENMIDSPTTVRFHDLKLAIKPGKENAQFLQTAVNKLAPYLTSQQGDIYFDFVIKGPAAKPQAGLGPRVKFAIGVVALEELSNALQQIQKFKQ